MVSLIGKLWNYCGNGRSKGYGSGKSGLSESGWILVNDFVVNNWSVACVSNRGRARYPEAIGSKGKIWRKQGCGFI